MKFKILFLVTILIPSIYLYGQQNNYAAFLKQLIALNDKILSRNFSLWDIIFDLEKIKQNPLSLEKKFYTFIYKDIQSLLNERINNIALKIYVVKKGDNLWNIAARFKSSQEWNKIYFANKDKISDPDLIHPQQTLIIPEFTGFASEISLAYSPEVTSAANSDSVVEEKINNNMQYSDIEIDALIVNETITKTGNDFYDILYAKWQAPHGIKNYTIVVQEKPIPGTGTQVSIKVNDLIVFERFIQPRYEVIEESASSGIMSALNYLENYEQIKRQLQGEDMHGTGIF